ncbi:MAG: transcription antitermination factor NusB [Actinomycetes bacterium]
MAPGPDAPAGAAGAAPRRLAVEVLERVEHGAYANLALPAALGRSGLADQDRALVTDLVYGTLRRRRACDAALAPFLERVPTGAALQALRLGAYQLRWRTDMPQYAAVDATVSAAPKRLRGLVNAVLRKVARAVDEPLEDRDELSYPDWVVDRLVADLGEGDALAALWQMNEPARPTVRPDGYVQDLASQWVVAAVGACPGDVVVDVCAAPGGKATGLAATGATVVALDLHLQRAGLVAGNAERLGQRLPVLAADATRLPLRPGRADRVLVDAPCSGLGVLRRRPDARWRVDPALPERLAHLQRQLLDAAVPLLRPGGTLVYSVCTLTAAESTEVDEHLAAAHPSLVPLDPVGEPWQPWGRGARILPQWAGTDGMCCFRYQLSS